MSKIFKLIWQDRLLMISLAVLIIVSCFVMPTFQSIDWSTIEALATLMLGVELMNHFHLLAWVSQRLLQIVNNTRQVIQLMVGLAFFASMILTNDVSIITLVPIYLTMAKSQHLSVCLPVTLITIAANLGSSAMPFGNPQNLFLVNYYDYSFFKVVVIMGPAMLIGLAILELVTYFIPKKSLQASQLTNDQIKLNVKPVLLVSGLMILTFLAIFKIIPLILMFIIMLIAAMLLHRQSMVHIDYGLLATFICFFLIVGELGQMDWVNQLLKITMNTHWQQYGMGVLVSQFISNVPAAVLLAHFTNNGIAMLMGTNVGGLGTLVASLANLLAFKVLIRHRPELMKRFLGTFTFWNCSLLLIMVVIGGLLIL